MVEMNGRLSQAFHCMEKTVWTLCLMILGCILHLDSGWAKSAASRNSSSDPSSRKVKSSPSTKASQHSGAPRKKKRSTKTLSQSASHPPFRVNPPRPTLPAQPVPVENGDESESSVLRADPAFSELDLPTDNQMIFSKTNPNAFFQPTFSGRMVSGMFGCVRNPGKRGLFTRFHEGVDIRPVARDKDGEPQDDVRAAGEGTVVYVCRQAGSSNYGKYVVIEHRLLGPPFYTLYAHMASVEEEIETGAVVKRGQKVGVLGRTSNEFDIDADHAHLHFEVNLMVNRHYLEWSRKKGDGAPRHGLYNGANLLGLDPVRFFQFLQINSDLGVGDFVRRERVAFRVLTPLAKDFSWIEQYSFALSGPITETTRALEISMTYYGLPVRVVPQSREEIAPARWKALANGIYPLTFADTRELTSHACCALVISRGKYWRLGPKGYDWLRQLLFHEPD